VTAPRLPLHAFLNVHGCCHSSGKSLSLSSFGTLGSRFSSLSRGGVNITQEVAIPFNQGVRRLFCYLRQRPHLIEDNMRPALPDFIDLPNGKRLIRRRVLAEKRGYSDKTAARQNLPTVYVRMEPYVDEAASLQDIADKLKRRHQPPKHRRTA
jgi:hypothetical protein